MITDPFRRNVSQRGGQAYPAEWGMRYLMEKMLPYLLVRTDNRVACVCQDPSRKTGDEFCSLCLGTGRHVRSLDRFAAYITSNAIKGGGNANDMGRSDIGALKVYCGRWVLPSKGDLILQVGWNCDKDDIYRRGRPSVVNKVLQIRDINYGTATQVTYLEIATVESNTQAQSIEDILLFGTDLPPYKNSLAE